MNKTPQNLLDNNKRYRAKYKERVAQRNKQWREETGYIRKKLYGLDKQAFGAMLQAQKFACAICRSPFETGKHTHVDHDHLTKRIRGLLCPNCNHALGKFKDSIFLLEAAIQYLKGK